MASNTENLDLLMKNPSTDGADTFNVQTMLNENWQKIDANAGTVAQTLANILKPTTPPIIGLPPSTTPDGMFQALGNTGELHVWRKTVVTAAEIPAGYTLGSAEANVVIAEINNGYGNYEVTITYGTSVHVSDAGIASSSGITSFNTLGILTWGDGSNRVNTLRGKFCKVSSGQGTVESRLFYVPNNATLTYKTVGVNNQLILSSLQPVNPYPLTPAGTTTTYPVSTNPNAYQEGDDAKAAGYTLGEVETGKFALGVGASGTENQYQIANSITVDDSGNVSLVDPTYMSLNGSGSSSAASNTKSVIGKFLIMTTEGNVGDFPADTVWFIPSDANTGNSYNEGDDIYNCKNYVTKRQPVTGYPAIPAGTTIEYLGKLGDKARVQVVSYVGTGTYGNKNKTSITFDLVPKIVFIAENVNYQPKIMTIVPSTLGAFGVYLGGGSVYGLVSPDVTITGKRISFFSATSSGYQMNDTGKKYFAIAIG